MITSSTALARHPAVGATSVGDEEVVVPSAGAIHVLEPIAALLWRCLDGVSSISEIAADFADQFDVATDDVLEQFTTLATHWHDAGLVSTGEAAEPATPEWRRLPPAPDP